MLNLNNPGIELVVFGVWLMMAPFFLLMCLFCALYWKFKNTNAPWQSTRYGQHWYVLCLPHLQCGLWFGMGEATPMNTLWCWSIRLCWLLQRLYASCAAGIFSVCLYRLTSTIGISATARETGKVNDMNRAIRNAILAVFLIARAISGGGHFRLFSHTELHGEPQKTTEASPIITSVHLCGTLCKHRPSLFLTQRHKGHNGFHKKILWVLILL